MTYRYGYGIGTFGWILITAVAVLLLIAGAKILKKGGESGWKILIPIYGSYCLYKVARSEGIFWASFGVSVATSVITSIITSVQANSYSYYSRPNQTPVLIVLIIGAIIDLVLLWKFSANMADAFGQGTGFAVGLLLLSPIFLMILGFGSAEYKYGYSSSTLDSMPSSTGTWKCRSCGRDNPISRGSCQYCSGVKQ